MKTNKNQQRDLKEKIAQKMGKLNLNNIFPQSLPAIFTFGFVLGALTMWKNQLLGISMSIIIFALFVIYKFQVEEK